MVPDPIVQEIRDNFAALAEECGNDFDRIVERLRREQAEYPDRLVSHPGAIRPLKPPADSPKPVAR